MRLDFEDGTKIIEQKDADTFFMGFNTYLFLRKSCYQCKYVGTERIADVTLADFWGVDLNSISDEQRKNGVSLILANSEKGKHIISELEYDMEIMPADMNRAISANQALSKPSSNNVNRDEFFKKLNSTNFDSLVHRFNRRRYVKLKMRKLIGNNIYERIKKGLGR